MAYQDDYQFFECMLNTIPPSAYFDEETKNNLQGNEELSDGEIKVDKKRKRNQDEDDKSQKKKRKVDLLQTKTVSQIREEICEEQSYSKIKEKKKHKKNNKNKKLKKLVKDKELDNAENRQEMLRERLRARINELQVKRNINPDEAIEKKKLIRKESKLKLKIRKNEKHKTNKSDVNSDSVKVVNNPKPTPIKPVYNKEGKMVFSKFDFSNSKEKLHNDLTGKDYKRLLEKIEKKKEKIKNLKEKDETVGKQLEEKCKWLTVLDKAQGVKVKDNPELLKKSLKRKEKLKEKRRKKWGIREKQTKQRMNKEQDKREKNIQARKQLKKDKKVDRAKKKGRVLPGF